MIGGAAAFCARADLQWMKGRGLLARENLSGQALADLFFTVYESPKPVIAYARPWRQGRARGRLRHPVAALGASSGSRRSASASSAVSSPYVVSKIGESAARELFLTGERFEAVKACEIGLVRQAVPEEDLDQVVEARIGELLQSAPRAVAEAKALIREVAWRRVEDVQRYTVERIADIRISAEAQEGMKAFLEKRKPYWVV